MDTIKAKSKDLAHLRIRTMIGKFVVSAEGEFSPIDLSNDNNQAMESNIDLIDGDITTAMSEKFVNDPDYVKLREFHLRREQSGHEIITNNINTIKKIIELLVSAKKDEKNVIE